MAHVLKDAQMALLNTLGVCVGVEWSGCLLKVMEKKLPVFSDLYTLYIQLLRGGLCEL